MDSIVILLLAPLYHEFLIVVLENNRSYSIMNEMIENLGLRLLP